ncbi:putative quinol monooxygenase [Salininema proteolyticum]|uniref:Quinol monooxygenase n=1 Tax=Salininema proteolyticum TaxID=1607685 RepID=A0ABV8U0I6_9ACTN
MILINVKFPVKPEVADSWPEKIAEFTNATRAEEGNVFFEWSRSINNPNEYVLLEAFRDAEAGDAHVNSDHFKKAMGEIPDYISAQPKIIYNGDAPDGGWGPMAELSPR